MRQPTTAELEALAALLEAQRAYDEAWRTLVRLQEEASRRPGRPDAGVAEAQARVAEAGRRLRSAGRALRDVRAATRGKGPRRR